MAERQILIADIEFILGNPEVKRPGRYPTDVYSATIFDRIEKRTRTLRVYVDPSFTPWTVTTVAWEDE